MNKKQKGIMIWMIIWAGLLIVVLYSPIGSPDLYTSQNYYFNNQGIALNTVGIQNAPKANYAPEYNSDETDIPQINSLSKTNYSVGNYQSTNESSRGSSYSVQSQSYQNNSSSVSGGVSGGGTSFIASGGSRNSTGTSGISMTNGITSLSLSTDISKTTSKQSVTNYTAGTGGTDPGGDPTGPPIPVGDGWELLILFGVCYAAYKMKSVLFSQLHFHSSKRNK